MLPSLTASFLLGLCAGSYLPFFPVSVSVLLAAAAMLLTLCERAAGIERRWAASVYGAMLAGVIYWSAATPPVASPHPLPPRRDTVASEVTGRILTAVQHAPGRQTAVVEVEQADPAPAGIATLTRVRVVWREPDQILLQGDRVRFRAKVHPPTGTLNPGGFDYAGYLERQGIDAVATVTGPSGVQTIESGGRSWAWAGWHKIDEWRSVIRQAASQTLSQPSLGIFLGMIIGERGSLHPDVQEWFMTTGTVHLLSISGSHLGLVAIVGVWVVRRAVLALPAAILLAVTRVLTPLRIAVLVTWPLVFLYALLAGAEVATVRALVMITLGFLTLWLGYERHARHALALAALLIVVHDPRALYDLSFQLSFLSVLAIIHALPSPADGEEERRGAGRLGTWLVFVRDACLVSAAVTLATLPLVALYFNQIQWMGLLTNLLAVPVTGVILVPLGLLSALWTVAASSAQLPLASLQEALFGWFVAALRWCAQWPGSAWHVAAPALPAMVVFYLGLWLAIRKGISRRWSMAGAAVVLGLIGWWGWSPRSGLDGDHWRVTFLDVGQGDSALLELPDGTTVLVDGGARYERFDMGRSVIGPFLWNRGIRHLDHVIGTHPQLDHVGGLIWIVRHIHVGRYWSSGTTRDEQFAVDLQRALQEARVSERAGVRGQELLGEGPCRLKILNPLANESTPVAQRPSGALLNNRSIVSRLECGSHAVLFAGDIEVDGLRRLGQDGRDPVTVLKVPHHGSRSSLDAAWIHDVHPLYAVVSVGRANSYGHPVQAVLDAYAEQHSVVTRTDQDGAIWVTARLSSREITVTRMRDLMLEPVVRGTALWQDEQRNWRRALRLLHDMHPLPLLHS